MLRVKIEMKAKAKIVSIEMTQKELHDFIEDYLHVYSNVNNETLPSDLFNDINDFIDGQFHSLESDGFIDIVGTIYEGK